MFRFIKKFFIQLISTCTIGSFGESLVSNSKEPIKCVSVNNQCKATPTLVNINSNGIFNPTNFSVNKCGGS